MPLPFPEIWHTCGIAGALEVERTYGRFPLRQLPPVDAPDDLSWLPPFDASIISKLDEDRLPGSNLWAPYFEKQETTPDEPDSYHADRLALIVEQAAGMQIELPTSFLQLFRSARMQSRLFSPTACEFELAERGLTPAPFGIGGWILRFQNDQQWCVCWYLFLPVDGSPVVLCSGDSRVAMTLEEHDPNDPEHIQAALDATWLVADSFPEYLYRLWLDTMLAFKLPDGPPLTPPEADYLEQLKLQPVSELPQRDDYPKGTAYTQVELDGQMVFVPWPVEDGS